MSKTRLMPALSLEAQLEIAVTERQDLVHERDLMQQRIRTLSDEIGTALAEAGTKTATVGDYLVVLVENQGSSSLDKQKLLELGVTPEVILAATRRGAPSVTLHVRKTKTEDGDERA